MSVLIDEPDVTESLHHQLGTRWDSDTGLLAAMCRHALTPAGKLFRPTLLVTCARAVGGRAEQVLPAAVGTESGHVASLVHDDIIDEDLVRRGRPAVHAQYGAGNAIVAGDALLFDLFLCLADCRKAGAEDSGIVTTLEIVARAGLDLCQGQSLEFEITEGASHDLDRYLLMIGLKTGALFRGSCQSGAVLGGGSDAQVDALGRYGDHLGLAFQMCDDLFTYTGRDDEEVGKSLLSDIRNRRMTLPVILAYRDADAKTTELLNRAFADTADPATSLDLVRVALERTDAIASARTLAKHHAGTAIDALSVLEPSPSRDQLASYAEMAVDRVR